MARKYSSKINKKLLKIISLFLFKGASFLIIFIFALMLLEDLNPNTETLSVFVDTYILEYGAFGMFVFMLLCSILSSFFVPRQVLSAVGGYAYGTLLGTFIVTVGVSIGCYATFLYSRFLLQDFVQKTATKRIFWLEHLFSKHPFGMAVSLRFIPVGSNVFLNMLAGVTKMPVMAFTLGSAIGYIPQNLVTALLGSGLRADPWVKTSLAGFIYILGIIAGLWLFKKYRPDENTNLKSIIKAIFKPDKGINTSMQEK